MILGEMLKKHREEAGLTYKKAATRLKLRSVSTIYRIEGNTLVPSPRLFYSLLKLYRLDMAQMYEVENSFYVEKCKKMGLEMRSAKKAVFK